MSRENTAVGTVHAASLGEQQYSPVPRSIWWIVCFALASGTMGIGGIAYLSAVVPQLVARLTPDQPTRTSLIILVAAVSAIVSASTCIGVGRLVDRWPANMRTLYLVAALGAAVAVAFMPFLKTIGGFLVGTVFLLIAMNTTLAVLSALIPDEVPLSQRALVATAAGLPPIVCAALAQQLIARMMLFQACAVLGIVLFVMLLLFLLHYRTTTPRVVVGHQPVARSSPLALVVQHPDFVRVWAARALTFLGYTTMVNYLSLLLAEKVGRQAVATTLPAFFGLSTLALVCSAITCGLLSDRLQRRKPFVVGASVLLMLSFLSFLVLPWWVAAVLLGLGMGGYVSAEFALSTQVLPGREHGRAMGIVNAAIYLPQLLTPLLVLLSLQLTHTYMLLLLTLAQASAMTVGLIAPMKRIR